MATGKTTNIKSLLRDKCLPALNQRAPYFGLAHVRAWLRARQRPFPPDLLREYISDFMRAGLIHIHEPYVLAGTASICGHRSSPTGAVAALTSVGILERLVMPAGIGVGREGPDSGDLFVHGSCVDVLKGAK